MENIAAALNEMTRVLGEKLDTLNASIQELVEAQYEDEESEEECECCE